MILAICNRCGAVDNYTKTATMIICNNDHYLIGDAYHLINRHLDRRANV